MASWFTQALDKVTPWDRGGEVQRRKEKKQQEQNQPKIVRPTPNPGITTNADRNMDVIKGQKKKTTSFGTLDMPNKVAVPTNDAITQKPVTPKPTPKVDAMTAIRSSEPPKPSQISVSAPKKVIPNMNTITTGGTKPASPNKKFEAGYGKGTDWKNVGKGNVSGAGKAGVEVGQGLVDIVTAPQKITGWGLNKVTGDRYKENIDLATGRYAANKMSQAFNKPKDPLTKWRGDSEAAKGADSMAYALGGLVSMVSPSQLAGKSAKVFKTGDEVLNGAKDTPLIVSAGKGLRNLANKITGKKPPAPEPSRVNVPVTGGEKTGTKIPTRVATGPTIEDVTMRLPGDKPALAPTKRTKPSEPPRLIQDVGGGETFATPDDLVKRTVDQVRRETADRFNSVDQPAIGDKAISNDVTPRKAEPTQMPDQTANQQKIIDDYAKDLKSRGEGNGVELIPDGEGGYTRISYNVRSPELKGKRMKKSDWKDEAERQLRSGQAEPGIQQSFNELTDPEIQSLLAQGDQVPGSQGIPIRVKQVQGIDVQQVDNVPTNMPEVPGTVRATTQTDPVATQTQAVASQPTVAPLPPLPKVGTTLDDGRVVTKAMLNKARENRKNVKKYNKVQAETQALIDGMPGKATQVDANGNAVEVVIPQGNQGHAATDVYRKGKNGNITESATRESDNAMGQSDVSTLSAGDIIQRAQENITATGTAGVRNVIDAKALRDSGRFPATSPEYKALNKIYNDNLSEAARTMGLADKAARSSASGDQIANRFVNKLLLVSEDGSRMTEGHIAAVKQADNAFTEARDTANRALDNYNATKSEADWNTWKQAREVAYEAEKHALITEYRVANDVLKGNKNQVALKAIEEAQQDAGVYQMDWIDANMLSGTGTGFRNYFNTSGIRLENSIFGRMAGGYSGKGAKIGNKLGNKSVVSDFKARNELDQNILNKAVRQWSTTMNTLGEGNIKAVAYGRAYKHYEKGLKEQGITGDQLKRDVEVKLHTDPEKMVAHYEDIAMHENALSALAHSKKIEQNMADMIAGKGGNKAAQLAAKLAVRLTIGFPTVIGRSLVGGVKRATLGAPERIHAAFVKNDPLKKADLIYSAKVHGGSGAMLYTLGAGLAATGVITGAYPDDQAERDKWKREGRQANSINIAGNWFSIPGYFGALALPLLVPAYVKDARSVNEIKNGIASAVMNMSPTDSMSKFFAGLEGRGGDAWGKNLATSAVRAVTPAGALFNQLARMTDTTKNDTTTKSDIMNLLDSIAGGIPGVNNMVNKIDATDDQGNVLHNPPWFATFLGASGQNQQAGIEDSQQIQTEANDTYASLKNVGVLDNANLMDLVDEKVRSQIERGQDLTPEQVTEIQKTVTKGVSTSLGPDSDSNWRENGDYATDLVAYQVKLQQLEADPRAKKSDIEGVKTQIARSKVLQDNEVPYETLKLYQTTSQTDWASMGRQYDKNGDANEDYDPDTYNILMNLDKLMTDAKGSYKESHPDKNKYNPKGDGSGYGSGGGRKAPKMSTDFGTLSTSGNPMAPKVRQYETANMAGTSGIPVINVVRPNIIHKIGRG